MRLLSSALVLLALVGTAWAQGASVRSAPFVLPSGAPAFSGNVEAPASISPELVAALEAPSAAVRSEALHAVANLAYSPQGVDLSPAVPALLDIFRTDPAERHRIMALRSLETTADEGVMTALRREGWREAQRDHPAVRRLLLFVLVDHYGLEALQHDSNVEALAQAVLADGQVGVGRR